MPDLPSLSAGEATLRWLLQTLIFVLTGGLAAGASSFVYESVTAAENDIVVYGIVFAAAGGIAYQLSGRVLDGT